MEAAVVKPKPRIRAAVRDGLNRFQLVGKLETDEKQGATQLKRLAAISRAHLASVRRTARGIKFEARGYDWRLEIDLGIGAPTVEFSINQTEMSAIVKLLNVPIHMDLGGNCQSYDQVVCKEMKGIVNFVNGLSLNYFLFFPDFTQFIKCVAPRLKHLKCPSSVLARFPRLDLERLELVETDNYAHLRRHKIRRLDVPRWEINRAFPVGQVLSASITSLGLHAMDVFVSSCKPIKTFCRRFSALEELHVFANYGGRINQMEDHFKTLRTACIKLRDQLNIPGLKRFFFTIEHGCVFYGTQADLIEKLKQMEPFEKATFTIDRPNKRVRMFLKHNEPRGQKPTFVCIKGDFSWTE
ncbi:hypothetical protein M3Y99_00239800 [Aphelenchoides fujianensis]|nr:hypothetical protein M3Y99_00239800 [Aphelenchoides fujianensis]